MEEVSAMLNDDMKTVLTSGEDAYRYVWDSLIIVKTKRTEPYTAEEINKHFYANDGVLEVWYDRDLTFNEDPECLYTPYDKWLLLVARYADHEETIEKLKDIAIEIFEGLHTVNIKQDVLRMNHFRDGGSQYVLSDYEKEMKVSMKEFIMDPSLIVIDNQNKLFPKLIASGIINVDNIEDYVDKYSFEEE